MNENGAVLVFVAALSLVLLHWLRERSRRREAREIAEALVPEIRAVLASLEAEPRATPQYAEFRQRLAGVLPKDTLFAVETFYQCEEAFREASVKMAAAFSDPSDLDLGDRIRAKERRDRCLKDAYYTGESAVEGLRRFLR